MSRARKAKVHSRSRATSGDVARPLPDDPVEALIARAQKSRRRGDVRRASLLLQEACALDEWRARSWALFGALLADQARRPEAERAFRQARWLRMRAGERARAFVLDRLIARVGEREAA